MPKIAIALHVLLSIGALGGGVALMAGPHGEVFPLPTAALAGSPFADYFGPGLILFTILGLGPAMVAVLAWRRSTWASILTVVVGAGLIVWIVVEIAIIGYSNEPPLQAFYLALGIVIMVVGIVSVVRSPPWRGAPPAVRSAVPTGPSS